MNTQANRDENENMMAVEIELSVEELEEIIAPGLFLLERAIGHNHNETLISDTREIVLSIEELEELIAPALISNHNEALVSDPAGID